MKTLYKKIVGATFLVLVCSFFWLSYFQICIIKLI